MVGLSDMLSGAKPVTAGAAAAEPQVERREVGGAVFEIHDVAAGAPMVCRLTGHPERLSGARFGEEDCRAITLRDNRLLLGLGAFGEDFDSSRDRFGEFLAVEGAGACQPTDGANFPDYMLTSGTFVPRLSVLYGLCCDGAFAKLVRFESASGKDPVSMGLIVETCAFRGGRGIRRIGHGSGIGRD